MRVQTNTLFRELPVELESFFDDLKEYISAKTVRINIEEYIDTCACVCTCCGTELYGKWHIKRIMSCFYDENSIPPTVRRKIEWARTETSKRFDAILDEQHSKFNCPICGEENKYGGYGNSLDEKFTKVYESMHHIATYKGKREAEHFSAQCDLPVATTNFANISAIKNDPEYLKEYLVNLIQLETNIMLLTKRLSSLYCERIIATRDVNRVNFEPVAKVKAEKEIAQKKYDDAVNAHKICEERVKSSKSISPKPVEIPMPPKPAEPEYLKPGLFNKKKVLTQNEALTEQYQRNLRKYDQQCQQRLVEITEKNEAAKKEHLAHIREAEKAEQKAKQEMEKLQLALMSLVPTAPVEVCPEKAKLTIIANEIEKTQDLLKKTYQARNGLYAANIIFGKYRDIIALSTFYEYLMAGRCASLDGADGAYNLYEMELRANMIIAKLSDIEKSLKKIGQTQYMICQQLTEMNNALDRMNNTMDAAYSAVTDIRANTRDMTEYMAKVFENTNVIAHNSAITAYYSKINAELTNALGFMVALK